MWDKYQQFRFSTEKYKLYEAKIVDIEPSGLSGLLHRSPIDIDTSMVKKSFMMIRMFSREFQDHYNQEYQGQDYNFDQTLMYWHTLMKYHLGNRIVTSSDITWEIMMRNLIGLMSFLYNPGQLTDYWNYITFSSEYCNKLEFPKKRAILKRALKDCGIRYKKVDIFYYAPELDRETYLQKADDLFLELSALGNYFLDRYLFSRTVENIEFIEDFFWRPAILLSIIDWKITNNPEVFDLIQSIPIPELQDLLPPKNG